MEVSLGEQQLPFFFWKVRKDATVCDTIHVGRLLLDKIGIGLSILPFSGAFVSQQ
jgi:hypothetical protein